MLTLVLRARRRLLQNELLCQGANAASAAVVAFILLLLAGAQILSWQWFLLIPLAALAAGLYRTFRRVPSTYAVAQLVDRRMNLADTLSTALYFRDAEASAHTVADMRHAQAEKAEQAARSVDVRQAVPYAMPRSMYLMAALVLIAASLFALRYGLSRRLDLKPPLASMLMQQFGWTPKKDTAHDRRRTPPVPEAQDDNGAAADPQDRQGEEKQSPADNQDPNANGEQAGEKNGGTKQDAADKGDKGDPKNADDQDAQAEKASDSANADSDSNNKSGEQGSKSEQAQNNPKSDSGSANDSPSLWSKVKDAAQNLLSRMKPQQGNQNPQAGQNDQANKQQGQGQQNSGKQQQNGKQGQQSGEQPGDSQEGQNGEEAQNQQDPQGKGTGKSDSQQASKQPGSGVGSQDGDKSIKQAEQLAAMGKISEILGKRSATVTGEATVEVQNTSQQLHTQYVQRGAQHTQGGAEISRDEIPVALQNYVEQYIELVRKQAPATTAAPAAPKKQ